VRWQQMGDICDEIAYSGKKSCKINANNPYGISFVYPVDGITKGYLDSVNIMFQCYCTTQSPDAQLVITLLDQQDSLSFSKEITLSQFNLPIYQWKRVSKTIKLPEYTVKAKLIKIFVYNPNKNTIFVDDMLVKFLRYSSVMK
jgi:hypothetical protein